MPGAVFGDFLAVARQHLEAAVAVRGNEVTSLSAVAGKLARLVSVMSRYCDDLAPYDEVEAAGRDDLHPWERAATDSRAALRIAAGCLRRASAGADGDLLSGTASPRARQLEAAATELAAGRDLLHTHLATGPDGQMLERSEWASAVTSVPVTRALADEIGQWSLRLAPFTMWLASSAAASALADGPGQAAPVPARTELATANQWLQAASVAVRPALQTDPVRPADAELLCAIPAAMVPQRRRPSGAEPVAGLCDGIAISAARLRGAMRDSKDRARWSPNATSGGWQWMAQAAAVTSHLSELALRTLAARVGELPGSPASEAQLGDAADFLVGMRAAWHQVDRMWDMMITESRMLTTQAMTDASDLVLRMGRLAWDDPQWTPARSRRALLLRSPAALAPGSDAVSAVVAAVHQSVDALACVAKADMDAVETAGQAGRLYVPTRSLPGDYDVPRPFATAPVSQCRALWEAYSVALHASVQAAWALDGLAVAADAPSKALALARAAAPAQSRRRGTQPHPDNGVPGDPPLSDTPFTHSRAATGRPGPLEEAIRARRVSDPVILMRAAAIDNAARQLIIQAQSTPSPFTSPGTPVNRQRSASSAAQLAAQSFPDDLTTRPAARQPPAERYGFDLMRARRTSTRRLRGGPRGGYTG
jgi:hypothetical protein